MTKLGIVVKRAFIVVVGTLVVLLAVLATFAWYSDWSVRADHDERARNLSGDELIPKPAGSVTHAITIRRSPHDIWPWLAQMGSGRAGWYAYDFIDKALGLALSESCLSLKTLVWARYSPRSQGSRTCSSSRVVSRSMHLFSRGDRPTAHI